MCMKRCVQGLSSSTPSELCIRRRQFSFSVGTLISETAVRIAIVCVVVRMALMRYLVQFDGRSIALESGRYMETVGEESPSLVTS
jgi:hypothetical protein